MALREPFRPLYRETEETVRDRLLSALPEELSRVEGSFARDVLEVSVIEFVRLWDEMNRYLSYTFPTYAWGQVLDAHAAIYGIERGAGAEAKTTIRFTGAVGTPIAPATIVSVPSTDPDAPRAYYQTTNTTTLFIGDTGYVESPVIATTTGVHTNQAPGAITLLETPIDGITAVTNLAPAVGGEDPESDDDLRVRVQLAASLPTGSGTRVDYMRWALEVPGVHEVAVEPLWDDAGNPPGSGNTAGSVRLSVRGPSYAPVDWSVLQEVQKTLDPSRQMLALTEEGESWTVTGGTRAWDYTNVQTGASALSLVAAGAATVTATLTRTMDLSRFHDEDAFYVWLWANDWSRVAATSFVRFSESPGNHFQATLAQFAPEPGLIGRPTTGTGWWLFRLEKNALAPAAGNGGAGVPSWSGITSVSLGLVATAAVTLTADYWVARSITGAAGEGRAPIGAAITVVTPVPRSINVSVAVLPDNGYTLTGAPGTTNLTTLLRDRVGGFLLTRKPGEIIRVVDIANAVHDTPGVVDFVLTAPAANINVTMHEYAVLGTFTVVSL